MGYRYEGGQKMICKFCDKCGKRITFDGDPEDCYSLKTKVIAIYLNPVSVEHKLELDFCDDCLVALKNSKSQCIRRIKNDI